MISNNSYTGFPFPSITVKNPNKKTYEFITLLLTWKDAQVYCRTDYTDLPTIESSAENAEVYSKIHSSAWIGLYREPWTWSDSSSSVFRNWALGEPNNAYLNQYCVKENALHKWIDDNCNTELSFLCYKGDGSLQHIAII